MAEGDSLPFLVQVTIGIVVGTGAVMAALFGRKKSDDGENQGVYRALIEMRNDQIRFANERNQKMDIQAELLRTQIEILRDIRNQRPHR